MIINHAEMPQDFLLVKKPADPGRLGCILSFPLPRRERLGEGVGEPNKAHFKLNMRRNLDMPDEMKELARAPDLKGQTRISKH